MTTDLGVLTVFMITIRQDIKQPCMNTDSTAETRWCQDVLHTASWEQKGLGAKRVALSVHAQQNLQLHMQRAKHHACIFSYCTDICFGHQACVFVGTLDRSLKIPCSSASLHITTAENPANPKPVSWIFPHIHTHLLGTRLGCSCHNQTRTWKCNVLVQASGKSS